MRHLRTEVIIGEAADPEAEPLVFEEEVKLEEGEVEVVVNLGDSLLGCLIHRLEVCSIVNIAFVIIFPPADHKHLS